MPHETTPKMEIAAGAYRLACDVVNPKPDRRSRRWEASSVWRAGSLFVVRAWTESIPDEIERTFTRYEILHVGTSGRIYQHERAAWNAIVPNLVAVPHTVVTLYTKYDASHWHPHIVADVLVQMGRVSLDDIEAALRASAEKPITETSTLFAPPSAGDGA